MNYKRLLGGFVPFICWPHYFHSSSIPLSSWLKTRVTRISWKIKEWRISLWWLIKSHLMRSELTQDEIQPTRGQSEMNIRIFGNKTWKTSKFQFSEFSIRVFPKIDRSGTASRIVSEQNNFSKKVTSNGDWTLNPRTIVVTSCAYSLVTRSTSRTASCGFLAFFRQDTKQKDFIKSQ